MTPGPRVEPRPHWWEASVLTTAPSLLPRMNAISFYWGILKFSAQNTPTVASHFEKRRQLRAKVMKTLPHQ